MQFQLQRVNFFNLLEYMCFFFYCRRMTTALHLSSYFFLILVSCLSQEENSRLTQQANAQRHTLATNVIDSEFGLKITVDV